MKHFKLSFLFTALCFALLLTGCIEDKGNSVQVTTTGSVFKTATGVTYVDLDYLNVSATSDELQKKELDEGDRVITTAYINFDQQEAPIVRGIYNASFLYLNEFDCENYIANPITTTYQSDTITTLATVSPFLVHRKKDNIITFAYTMNDEGNLKLIQPRPFDINQPIPTDTLYLVYDQGAKLDREPESDYISFKLPPYPVNTLINVVVRFCAKNYNQSASMKDKVSTYFSFDYYLKEGL